MYIYIIAAVFLLLILACAFLKKIELISYINITGMVILFLITLPIGFYFVNNDYLNYFNNSIYIDSLSLIQLFIITSIGFIAAIYSHKFIMNQISDGSISLRKAKIYYFLFDIFVLSMIFLCVSNNIMAMWIGLEATTLSTAFLIGFNNNKFAIEAAWKYIIICSIGIALGLVGIILFIYAADTEFSANMLKWTYLINGYQAVNMNLVKIAFTLIFVGIGTKASLAPMHTWLSDALSEAPTPISAILAGVLKNLAMYVILRFYIVIRLIPEVTNLKYLFIGFGIISLVIASFSLLKQTNYRRLLAFSSVENMGIICLGLGFGGTIGTIGALLHSIIHAYGKSLLFLVSGNIFSAYKTKRIDKINGLIKTMPLNSVFLIMGILVMTGAPPFAIFFSELKILIAGIMGGHYIIIGIFCLCLIVALCGFLRVFLKMVFHCESLSYKKMDKDNENILPLAISFGFVIFVSCTFNNLLYPILSKAVTIING
jgi:hydrogenase-4 component F